MLAGLTALFVVSYDAYADSTWRLAQSLREQAVQVRFLVMTKDGRQFFPDAVLDKLRGLGDVALVDRAQVATTVAQQPEDIFFLFFAALELEDSIRAAHAKRANPPVCISCFAGILLYDQETGLAQRLTSDIILFNSRNNLTDYQTFCARIGASADNALLFGFPALLQQTPRHTATPPKQIVYIDQAPIPASRADRMIVAQGLVDYAQQFPERDVKVLLRDKQTNRLAHPGTFYLDTLIIEASGTQGVPQNLQFSSENAAIALDSCDLCIGFSSTVLIHAIARRIPVAILNDVGCSPQMGNALFIGSGLESTFAQLLRDEVTPAPAQAWLDEHVTFPQERLAALAERIEQVRSISQRPLMNSAVARKRFWRVRLVLRIKQLLWPLKERLKAKRQLRYSVPS